jgi:O-antigen/teichoic acid export membrane protein
MTKVTEVKTKSVRGVVSYSLRTVYMYVIAVAATAMLSAFLSPEEFGIYFVVTSLIGLFTFMSDVGLAAALIQKPSAPSVKDLRNVFTVQQILAVAIFALSVLLTPLWRRFMNIDEAGLYLLYALGFSFILASLKTIPSVLLERRLDFGKLVIPSMVEQLVFYVVAVYLAWRGFGVNSFTAAVLLRGFVGVMVMYTIQRWSIGVNLSLPTLKSLLGFGFRFQLNDLLARMKDDLYIVVLAWFIPTAQMGYLGWAKRWSMFPYQFSVNNVIAITFPTYSRLQEDRELLKRAIEKSLYFISLTIFPILAGMSALSFSLIAIIPQYHKWEPALAALVFFCINIGFSAVTSPLTNTLNAVGKIQTTLKYMMLWTGLTWGLTPFLYQAYGFTGVAMVSALVGASSVGLIFIVQRMYHLSVWQTIGKQLIFAVIMGGSLYMSSLYWSRSLNWLVTGVGVGVMIYGVLVLLFDKQRFMTQVGSLLRNYRGR